MHEKLNLMPDFLCLSCFNVCADVAITSLPTHRHKAETGDEKDTWERIQLDHSTTDSIVVALKIRVVLFDVRLDRCLRAGTNVSGGGR